VVSRQVGRFISTAAALVAAITVALSAGPAAAAAAKPKAPPKPTAVQITGKTMPNKVIIQQAAQPQLFAQLVNSFSWVEHETSSTYPLKTSALGPLYTVTILVKNAPQHVYDVYPQATGWPRIHRKAAQPAGRTTDGWYYATATLPEIMRISGAPIPRTQDVVAGGIGGGLGEEKVADVDPVANVNQFLAEFRRLFLLNGAVLVVILFGLAGIAYLIRRRV
jgi:hypothetical protein